MLLSLVSLGVRLGRKGREAGADYPKPLGGLYGGFWVKIRKCKDYLRLAKGFEDERNFGGHEDSP